MPKKQTPEITIAEDKLVLAVAPIKVEGKFCYVYSLICPKENNSLVMEPKVEISITKDPETATMRYAVTKKMAEYQSKNYSKVYDTFKHRIDMFYQNIK